MLLPLTGVCKAPGGENVIDLAVLTASATLADAGGANTTDLPDFSCRPPSVSLGANRTNLAELS